MCEKKEFSNMRQVLEDIRIRRGDQTMIRLLEKHEVSRIGGDCFFANLYQYENKLHAVWPAARHIALYGRNSVSWLLAFYAVLDRGATAILFAGDDDAEQLITSTRQADVDLILCDEAGRERAEEVYGREGVPIYPMPHLDPALTDVVRYAGEREANLTGKDDEGIILFTSGTTGYRKAVLLSVGAVIASVVNDLVPYPFGAQLAVLPFHHLAGYNPTLNSFYLGREICMADDMRFIFETLEKLKPDYIFVVPSMASVLAKRLRSASAHGESLGWDLRLLLCGGADFPQSVLTIFAEKDIHMLQGYGASECGGIGFSWEMSEKKPDTIGRPNASMEIRLEDGELLIRSASVMSGYYKDPAATEEALRDGWYHTGDLARQDEEGYVYLTGRKKNLIILSNGENISPEELERVLGADEKIQEIVVRGEKDFLAAYIYPSCSQDAGEEVWEETCRQIRETIEAYNHTCVSYKKITFVHFCREAFAKNAMMKIIREGVGE